MSDYYLLFVPVAPDWQPTQVNAQRTVELLRSIAPTTGAIDATFSEAIVFHHPYGNWDGVYCPACASDLESWFYDMLNERFELRFSRLTCKTPCCGFETSLNDLDFPWPAAFGRFVLEARNPGVLIDDAQNQSIGSCLGMNVRKIWRRL